MKTPKFPPHRQHRELSTCPVCGHGFSAVDQIVAARDVDYQCRRCWNRVWPASRAALHDSLGLHSGEGKKHAGAA